MRLLTCFLIVLCLTVSSPIAKSQEKISDANLLVELTALEKASWEAAVKGDKEFFRTYLAADSKWFLADGSVVDRDQVLMNNDDFKLNSFKMSETSILRVSDDAAMIMYRVSYQGTHKNQKEAYADIESSSLYVSRDGKWLEIFYQETPNVGFSHGTAEEAKQIVAKAIALFNKEGVSAFEKISTGKDGLRDRDLYVFAMEVGPEAKVMAYGGSKLVKNPVGTLAMDVKSPDGDPIGKWVQERATEQGAWIDYSYIDPVTSKLEHKLTWIVRNGKHIFGCGIYTPSK